MTETFHDIQSPDGTTIARVVYNPSQWAGEVPYWIELAPGYTVYKGKKACEDRTYAERLPVGVM